MKHRGKKRKPAFLWQGALIALPILLLAGLGVYALRKDRALAMEDARQRAHEELRGVAANLGRQAASQLTLWDHFARAWLEHHRNRLAGWPGSEHRVFWEDHTQTYESQLNAWNSSFPKEPPLAGLPLDLSFSQEGELHRPRDYVVPPQPPEWSGDPESASVEAGWNTEWRKLREEAQAKPGPATVTNLLRFAGRVGRTPSESGLPLSSLVLLEVIRQSEKTGFTEPAWARIADELANAPSFLTPYLLNALDQACRARSELVAEAQALRVVWAYNERQREAARAIQKSGLLKGITTTNGWVGEGAQRMFVVAAPSLAVTHTSRAGEPVSITNHITQVQAYPKDLVEANLSGVGEALSLPDYCRLHVELAGEPLGRNREAAQSAVLAETEVTLTLPGVTLNAPPVAGQPLDTGPEFETLPSQPRLRLIVLLADSGLLLARQSQRQWLFGGLILVSMLAAGLGLVSTRRAFSKQQRLSELKDNFVSSVSHELRAPIASVRLMAESLESRKIPDPAKQSEYYRLMSQECRRLSSLIANVLDFSRIEQGRKEYQLEPTNLSALVKDTLAVMQPYAEERQVSLQLNLENAPSASNGNGCEALVDGKAIQQALINLVDNAIKHAPSKSAVTIGLEQQPGAEANGTTQLWVEDHGPGIPAAEHEKIFDRFYRLGSELRRETQGVGIGLSIVKHIVEAHGGKVLVRSAPGQGSRFTLQFGLNEGTAREDARPTRCEHGRTSIPENRAAGGASVPASRESLPPGSH